MRRLLISFMLLLGLAGCASQDLADYAQAQPTLDLAQFFNGRTHAWGMFQKRGGSVARRFQVTLDGRVEGNKLILDEHFRYDDGQTQQRVWTLVRQADGSWRGTAGDVRGEAVGHLAGNTFHWRYTLALPVKDDTYDMQMDDWMYLVDDKTLINRTSMRKFGIELGQVTVFFRKPE